VADDRLGGGVGVPPVMAAAMRRALGGAPPATANGTMDTGSGGSGGGDSGSGGLKYDPPSLRRAVARALWAAVPLLTAIGGRAGRP